MKFGAKAVKTITEDGEHTERDIIARGVPIAKIIRDETILLIDEKENMMKELTAHWFNLLSKIEKNNISYFELKSEKFDKKSNRFTRVRLITEVEQ